MVRQNPPTGARGSAQTLGSAISVRAMPIASQSPVDCPTHGVSKPVSLNHRLSSHHGRCPQPFEWTVRPLAASAPSSAHDRHHLWQFGAQRGVASALSVAQGGACSLLWSARPVLTVRTRHRLSPCHRRCDLPMALRCTALRCVGVGRLSGRREFVASARSSSTTSALPNPSFNPDCLRQPG